MRAGIWVALTTTMVLVGGCDRPERKEASAPPALALPDANVAESPPAADAKGTFVGKDKEVAYWSADEQAQQLLNLSLRCLDAERVTVREFLEDRVRTGGPLNLHYEVASRDNKVVVTGFSISLDGQAIPGIPVLATYTYEVSGNLPRLIDEDNDGPATDPLTFMQNHREAACNAMYRRHHMHGA